MDWYKGKRVFITGGSAGIGKAAALQAVRSGAHVFVAARGQARLDETLAELEAAAGEGQVVGAVTLDVTDRAMVSQVAQEVLDGLKGLDVLICNSGYAHTGWAHEVPDSDFDQLMTTNYLGHVNVVRAFLPHLRQQGSGDICLVSSLIAIVPMLGYTAYAGSKAALTGFGDALRQELKFEGVRVGVFYPPSTKTPGLERENEDKPAWVWEAESGTGWNKVYTAEEVGVAMLEAVRRGRFENVVGWDSRLFAFVFRHLPGLARWIWDGDVAKARERVQQREAGGS